MSADSWTKLVWAVEEDRLDGGCAENGDVDDVSPFVLCPFQWRPFDVNVASVAARAQFWASHPTNQTSSSLQNSNLGVFQIKEFVRWMINCCQHPSSSFVSCPWRDDSGTKFSPVALTMLTLAPTLIYDELLCILCNGIPFRAPIADDLYTRRDICLLFWFFLKKRRKKLIRKLVWNFKQT